MCADGRVPFGFQAEASSAAVDVIEENPASGAGERANEQSDKEEAPAEASKGRTGEVSRHDE